MTEAEIAALRAGEPRVIARTISAVERGAAREIIPAIFKFTGRAHIIGVTGSPGTGKSTFVNEIAKEYRRRNLRVGIIAVDPTSPFTGGALLGDRLRMQDLSGDSGVFVRSMATRGHLGGISAATADAVQVLDVAGFEVILVETVGAGQSEVDIAKNALTTIVVLAPGMGDDIQAIKAGILEIADILIVNKADRDEADGTVASLEMNLNLKPRVENEWRPPVLKTIALKGEGVGEVANSIASHRDYLQSHGLLRSRECSRLRSELENVLQSMLMARVMNGVNGARLGLFVDKIVARELDVYSAADQVIGG